MVVNCEHVWREVSNYLDDEIDAETRAAMEEHFKICKRCTAVLDGTRNVTQLYGDDRLFELPGGFSRRLQKRLAMQSSSGWLDNARTFWMLAVTAVALAELLWRIRARSGSPIYARHWRNRRTGFPLRCWLRCAARAECFTCPAANTFTTWAASRWKP